MTPAKILVTGATGFIGARFCERLKLHHRLPYRALVRQFTNAPRIARLDSEMVGGDLMQPDTIRAALNGCDAVVNLAIGDPQTAVKEARRLLAACVQANVRRFVHLSSMSVHGPNPGPECAHEETAVIARYGDAYSDAKAEVEELVAKTHRNQGLPVVILRPTVVYGPYCRLVMSIADQARRGKLSLIDEGCGFCNAVYVDDVCDAIWSALHRDEAVGQACFVTSDSAITWREFNLAFARLVNPDCQIQNFDSEEVRQHWRQKRSARPSNFGALLRLAASPAFHKQLATVPLLDALIRGTKWLVKSNLSDEKLLAIKRRRQAQFQAQPAEETPWPGAGQLIREAFPIQFSNRLAKSILDWQPRYDFQEGLTVTQSWMAFAGLLPPQE